MQRHIKVGTNKRIQYLLKMLELNAKHLLNIVKDIKTPTIPIYHNSKNESKASRKPKISGTSGFVPRDSQELILDNTVINHISRVAWFKHDYGHLNLAFVEYDGTMPSDSMDDIELKNIQLQFPSTRSLSREDSTAHEETVETDRGQIVVAVQGSRNKPAILTYHDLGLNYVSSFQAFFNYIDMRALLENFCVYHVNAPGQEEGAQTLPEDYIFPTMDELAAQLDFVLSHFALKQVIGFGVGAGANILARFALLQPNKVAALCLINCASTPAGWIEWGYQKLNARHLRSKGMTQGVQEYLMWHHFGRTTEDRNHDLVQVYKSYFERNVNPTNLALFTDVYVRRTDLNIQRELDPNKRKGANTLHMPVLNITGSRSPHVDDTITLNGRLDPTNSSWMKISDCGMVLEEQPGKVSEAFRLFLQGEGYAIQVGRRRASSAASM